MLSCVLDAELGAQSIRRLIGMPCARPLGLCIRSPHKRPNVAGADAPIDALA
jgi:hypothetical protein